MTVTFTSRILGVYMVETNISSLYKYRKNIPLPSSKCHKSRLLPTDCIWGATCAFSSRLIPQLCFAHPDLPSVKNSRLMKWSVKSSVDGGGSDPSVNSSNSGTRLVRAIQSFQIRLIARIKELRKGLPMKVLFFLMGFYCATAFATVIGQTGDWDILSAGLAVVVVEGIGALMYKASFSPVDRIKSFITIFNYWKAGLSLGLFLDAFKYEIDMIIGSCNPFNIDIDFFPGFW